MAEPREYTLSPFLQLLSRISPNFFGDLISKNQAKVNAKRGFNTIATPESAIALDTLSQKRKKGASIDITGGLGGTSPTLSIPGYLRPLRTL